MKNIKIVFLSLTCLILIFSCHKDELRNDLGKDNKKLWSRTTLPSSINGMLHFDTYIEFEAFQDSLKTREQDTTAIINAYAALGVDITSDSILNLTDHPICLNTELQIQNFVSARKIEEIQINSILNAGGDTFSIIANPYLKSVLNGDMSVNIGSRIYKFYENGGIAIIFNNDWSLYNTIKNTTFEDVKQNFNITISSDFRDDWENYFVLNSDLTINSEKETFLPRFYATRTDSNNLLVHNISIIESSNGSVSYKWLYSDNTTSNGINPNREIYLNENIQVVIGRGGGRNDTISSSLILAECPDIVITNLSNNQVRFEDKNWGVGRNFIYMRWVFSDGTTSNVNQNPYTRTCSNDGSVTCEYRYTNTNAIVCSVTLPYYCKCGELGTVTGSQQKKIGSYNWKIEALLAVNKRDVYLESKWFRRIAGIWFKKTPDAAYIEWLGNVKTRIDNDPCYSFEIFHMVSTCGPCGNDKSRSYRYNFNRDIFKDPTRLSSRITITVNNTTFGFGVNGVPWLVLN